MYKLESCVFMFKYHTNVLPPAFNDFFIKRSAIHNYPTRSSSNYNLTRNKKSFSDHSVRTSGVITWNPLKETLKQSKSTTTFRKQYKLELISSYK